MSKHFKFKLLILHIFEEFNKLTLTLKSIIIADSITNSFQNKNIDTGRP